MRAGDLQSSARLAAREASFEVKAYGSDPGRFRIGLAPIEPAHWFEPTTRDPAPRKTALLAASRETVWGETARSRPGQIEALGLVAGWRGFAPSPKEDWPPLLTAALLVEDDLCLMERLEAGWTLTAASLSSGSYFTPKETIGRPMRELHAPVPGFGDRFLVRVERIFDHLPSNEILERRNWSIVPSGGLSLPFAHVVRGRVSEISPETAADVLFVRSERQTIRRLPSTGGILFSIRIWRESLRTVLAQEERADAFKTAWDAAMQSSDPSVRDYKALALFEPLVRPLL